MTDPRPLVLIVDDEAGVRRALSLMLDSGGGYRLIEAQDGAEGLERARAERPDLIVSDLMMPRMDGFAFCRAVKAEPALAGTMFMMLTAFNDTERLVEGMTLGVDDFLGKPVTAPELLARARALIRHKQMHDRLRNDAAELQRMHGELEHGFEQVVALLGHLLDLARPGASDRGRRIAELATAIAERCDVAETWRGELRLAATLFQIGEVVGAARHEGEAGSPERWRKAVIAHAILVEVDRLRGVADLVDAIYENWDGTGFPGKAQRGQIPFRSRILRVAIDYCDLRDAHVADDTALERLMSQSGTAYDAAVLVQLAAYLRGAAGEQPGRRYVPVESLGVGMVLAEDLRTASGAMLLASGASISPGSLQIIQRRHASDPVLMGPYVME